MHIKLQDKTVHILGAVVSALLCVIAILWKPSLVKDAPTALGTLGTFATAYGVLFAIFELRRAEAASVLAQKEAARMFHAVTSLATAREVVECQSTITAAVASLDEGRAIPSSVLCQIVKLYSQVFHTELKDESSAYRKNRSVVESYSFNPNVSARGTSPRNTRRALLSIASQLAEVQGATKNFTEYTK
ncbi:hypothetical protein MCEMSEM18_03660 [Comamonadaceae bacterium]